MTDQKDFQVPHTSNTDMEVQLTSDHDQSDNQSSDNQESALVQEESTTSNVQDESQANPPSTTSTQPTGTTEAEYQAVVNYDFYHNSSDFELRLPGSSNSDPLPATNTPPNDDPSASTNPPAVTNAATSTQPPALTGTALHDAIEQELRFKPRASSLEYHHENVGPGGYLDPSQPLTTQQATVSHPVIQRVVAGLQPQDLGVQQQQQQTPTAVQQSPAAQQGPAASQTASTARDPRQLCICLGTHIGGNMVRCANNDCPKRWFHQECVGTQPIDWLCPVCKQVRPNAEAFGSWKKST